MSKSKLIIDTLNKDEKLKYEMTRITSEKRIRKERERNI